MIPDVTSTITFPARFAAITPIASPDSGRYAMNGVELRRRGAVVSAVATDGKRMVIATQRNDEGGDPAGADGTRLVLASTLKGVKPTRSAPELASVNGRLNHGSISLECPPVEGEYPPVVDVIPARRPTVISFNSALVRDTLDVLVRLTGAKAGDAPTVNLELAETHPDKSPMTLNVDHNGIRVTAIIMPVQAYEIERTAAQEYLGR